MWFAYTKLYISIVVIIMLIMLQVIGTFINVMDEKYNIHIYGAPTKCLSNALCAMSGNIFLLWIIYLIIPEEYYSNLGEILDPRHLHDTAKHIATATTM